MNEEGTLGTLSFLINAKDAGVATDVARREAEILVSEMFQKALERHGVSDRIRVVRAESQIGCIIVTLTIGKVLGTAAAAGAPFAVIAFFRDYPDVRQGIILAIKDLNMVRIRLAGIGSQLRLMCLFNNKIPGTGSPGETPQDIQ